MENGLIKNTMDNKRDTSGTTLFALGVTVDTQPPVMAGFPRRWRHD